MIILPTFIRDLETYLESQAQRWHASNEHGAMDIARHTEYLHREGLCFAVALAISREIGRRARLEKGKV